MQYGNLLFQNIALMWLDGCAWNRSASPHRRLLQVTSLRFSTFSIRNSPQCWLISSQCDLVMKEAMLVCMVRSSLLWSSFEQGKQASPHVWAVEKMATMVEGVMWHENNDMLAALADGKLTTWFYPRFQSLWSLMCHMPCLDLLLFLVPPCSPGMLSLAVVSRSTVFADRDILNVAKHEKDARFSFIFENYIISSFHWVF